MIISLPVGRCSSNIKHKDLTIIMIFAFFHTNIYIKSSHLNQRSSLPKFSLYCASGSFTCIGLSLSFSVNIDGSFSSVFFK